MRTWRETSISQVRNFAWQRGSSLWRWMLLQIVVSLLSAFGQPGHLTRFRVNRRLQWSRTTQFSVAEVESGNCKYGICALLCSPPRFSLLLYCRRFVQHGVRNCKSTLLQLWNCFTVTLLRSVCLAMHQITTKTKGRQLQRACKVRWLSNEATVRARSEILAILGHTEAAARK